HETGPVRLASSPRPRPAHFLLRKLRIPAASSTVLNRSFLAVAPPPPPPKPGVSTARTQQAGPSRGQAAWDYLLSKFCWDCSFNRGDSAKILVESLEF
ncbi:hypothetical protein Prudu_66S000500, partial [Prunus dulcis]